MMYEAAIGDAYGAGFECVSAPDLDARPNDLSRYYGHPRHNTGNGRYTDDTEMSTAVAEAILEGSFENGVLDPKTLAKCFVAAFHREQRHGYSSRFYNFMVGTQSADDFLANIVPDSDESGAAMRGWVVGLYPSVDRVMTNAEIQAKLTHDTPEGIQSAQAAALLAHYFVYDLGLSRNAGTMVKNFVPGPWCEPFSGPVGSSGVSAVHAAIQAVTTNWSLSSILRQCIAYGGDVDTVATIALGVASWSTDIDWDIPPALESGLESGPWGKDYLLELDQRLYAWCDRP